MHIQQSPRVVEAGAVPFEAGIQRAPYPLFPLRDVIIYWLVVDLPL
jgi:hypothetical protein